jgi:hypothetical protein
MFGIYSQDFERWHPDARENRQKESRTEKAMIRTHFLALVIGLCCLAGAATAQNVQGSLHASHRAHAKKVAEPTDTSEDWSIAEPTAKTKSPDVSNDPNLAEGRKKFFEQSTTVRGGGPAAASSTSGFTPSMGLSF